MLSIGMVLSGEMVLSGGGSAVKGYCVVQGMLSITGSDIIIPPPHEHND